MDTTGLRWFTSSTGNPAYTHCCRAVGCDEERKLRRLIGAVSKPRPTCPALIFDGCVT